jgi:hypothetical protein
MWNLEIYDLFHVETGCSAGDGYYAFGTEKGTEIQMLKVVENSKEISGEEKSHWVQQLGRAFRSLIAPGVCRTFCNFHPERSFDSAWKTEYERWRECVEW